MPKNILSAVSLYGMNVANFWFMEKLVTFFQVSICFTGQWRNGVGVHSNL